MAPRYIRPQVFHSERLELLTCLHLLRENHELLAHLRRQIMRRHLDPDGWAARFDDLLLENGCALGILADQIQTFWPEPPERQDRLEAL